MKAAKATLRGMINCANAARSTGPVTAEGKHRVRMNVFKHGLTGHRMILQEHELDAYRELTENLNRDFAPANEIERQLVQKIIDCHMRLSRSAAMDFSTLNLSLGNNMSPCRKEGKPVGQFRGKRRRPRPRLGRTAGLYGKTRPVRTPSVPPVRPVSEGTRAPPAMRGKSRQTRPPHASKSRPINQKSASFCKTAGAIGTASSTITPSCEAQPAASLAEAIAVPAGSGAKRTQSIETKEDNPKLALFCKNAQPTAAHVDQQTFGPANAADESVAVPVRLATFSRPLP